MCSLDQFPPIPDEGLVPICETEGRIQYCSSDNTNLSVYTSSLSNHPNVVITREMLHPGAVHTSSNQIFLPVTETLWKKLQNAWYENGFMEVLRVASSEQNGDGGFGLTCFCAQQLISVANVISKIYYRIPLLPTRGPDVEPLLVSSEWIRCMDWHPHCTKLAIATRDDTVRIYSSYSKLIPLLKCKTQRNVSSLAWRPLSASDIAVACEVGIYVWVVDPNSVVMRPSASSATLLRKPNHKNVTSITWSPQGDLLVSASKFDRTMYVWQVSTERAVPLQCVGGGGISLVSYSPDCLKVFAATNRIVFRMWDTAYWETELWSLHTGRVTCACWSACSTVLLFATSTEPVIYALTLGSMATVFSTENTKSAVGVVDITAVTLPSGERVGGEVSKMVWDPKSHYLAVSFHESELIAVFVTKVSASAIHVAPCCFIKGFPGEKPVELSFQKDFNDGANLTIAWSSRRVQYFPFIFSDLKSATYFSPSPSRTREPGLSSTSTVFDSSCRPSQYYSFTSP